MVIRNSGLFFWATL